MKSYFPILNQQVNHHPLVYLDSAATLQMPTPVMDALLKFYHTSNANIHRGIHTLSESATAQYEAVRGKVCKFIDAADPSEIVFTSGTTAGINMAAQMLAPKLRKGDHILITQMEHHSNLLPWRELAAQHGFILDIVPVCEDGPLDLDAFTSLLCDRTKVVAFTELSNVTGIKNPVKSMIQTIREKTSAWILVDGAQGVVHIRGSVREMDPDFYVFSGHKLGAPTGTGVLYIKKSVMNVLKPTCFGGGIVHSITNNVIDYLQGPQLFEPGTPNYAGVIGLGAAIDFWLEQGKSKVDLLSYLEIELSGIKGVHVLGEGQTHYGCLSFAVDALHPYDISRMLDDCGVAVRSGHLCAQPYIEALGYTHVVRVSAAPYNTMDEIEKFLEYFGQLVVELRSLQGAANVQGFLNYDNENKLKAPIQQVEAEILQQMENCKSAADRLALLTCYANQCLLPPATYRYDVYKLVECQVDAVVVTGWIGERRSIFVNSTSLLIKGVLAIIQKLFMGRTKEELTNYDMKILDTEFMHEMLAQGQIDALKKTIQTIKKSNDSDQKG